MSDLDGGAVGAYGRAVRSPAPDLIADFQGQRTGKRAGGRRLQLQTQTLAGFNIVFPMRAVARGAGTARKSAVLAVVKAHQPLSLYPEIDGGGGRGGGEEQGGGQEEKGQSFHGGSGRRWRRL